MRNQPETNHEYNLRRLTWWFCLSSLLFLGCLGLMIWVDYSGSAITWLGLRGNRQWKNHQREFYALERRRLAADAQAAELRANEAGMTQITTQLGELTAQLSAQQDAIATRQAEVGHRRVEVVRITHEFTMAKATRDEYRSFYEAALGKHGFDQNHPAVQDWKNKVDAQNKLVDDLQSKMQEADAAFGTTQAGLRAITGQRENLGHEQSRLSASRDLLQKRLAELDSPLVQAIVNAPIVEFAAPTYKVEQIVTEDHRVDINFTTVPRVDRCITCHKAIDRKDPSREELRWRRQHKIEAIEWSQLPQPLRSHPRLDLYVSDTAPHPAGKYGCTVCHWGLDRETNFSRAGHTPEHDQKHPHVFDDRAGLWERDEPAEEDGEDETAPSRPAPQTVALTQQESWKKNYHWGHQEFLVQPMRQQKYIQAACLKCHADQTNLPGAETLDHGRQLIGQLGCWGCHKMKQLETFSIHVVKEGEDFDGICQLYDVEPDQIRRLNHLARDANLSIGQELEIPIRLLHKNGPSLHKVATKNNQPWVRTWLANPVEFRPNTYMPRFWGLKNNQDPERDSVEINAVTEYLFAVSETAPPPEPPVPGDVTRGQKLVGDLGCLGCHVINERVTDMKLPKELKPYLDVWAYRRARSHGPQLAGTGSKTTVAWAYAWLKDPKQYHPGTKMPNLRLSDQEAVDVAAYLASLRNEKPDHATLPAGQPRRLDEVVIEHLEVTRPHNDAVQKLDQLDALIERYFVDEETLTYYDDPARLAREEARKKALQKEFEDTFDDAVGKQVEQLAAQIAGVKAKMQAARDKVAKFSPDQKKNVYLGSQLIGRYGCFACHNIHGFENAKPIGTELSVWGSKPVNQLDFGLVKMERTRVSFLKQELHEPRVFDEGRIGIIRKPQELLKMPKFNLTEDQVDQVVTFVSGMTDEKTTYQESRQLTPAEFSIERGRWLTKELNCVTCHIMEGKGGAVLATGIPAGREPPMVSGTPTQIRQGQRTQPEWLFGFLKAPVTGEVRPWQKMRMPTFGLSDAEANVLVKYFALEGRTQFPYFSPKIDLSPAHLAAGKQLFDQLKCARCHIVEGQALGKPLAEIPEEDLPRLAPDLSLAGRRLQREWLIEKWLVEPLAQMPNTRMPQFEYGNTLAPDLFGGDSRRQREALADYILSLRARAPIPAAVANQK